MAHNREVLLVFSIFVRLIISQRSSDYCEISPRHTMCLYPANTFGTQCRNEKIVPLTGSMKKFIVDLHNYYRSRVAVGAETRGSPGPQPKAANMKELVWDEELAQIAERWARQCRFEHDVNRDVKQYGVGQNLGIRFSSRSEKANWEAVIDSWYNEVEFANRRLVQQLSSSNLSRVGHYTQMVAANTEAIGCSAVTYEDPRGRFQNTILFVCNYGPLGNFIGRPLYKIGEPCSACPSGTKCVAGGLCA